VPRAGPDSGSGRLDHLAVRARCQRTLTFSTTNLDGVGQYQAYYLYNNGYQVLAGPISFSVVPSPPGRVTELSPNGRLITAFGGRHGRGAPHQPDGIAVGPNRDIWVSDTGSDQIVEFSPQGRPLQAFGSSGAGNGQLDQPQDLVISPSGDVYVADQDNNRVEEFSADRARLPHPDDHRVTVDGRRVRLLGGVRPWFADPVHRGPVGRLRAQHQRLAAQTCGDLTSAFRFGAPPARYPAGHTRLRLAAAEAALLTAQQEVNDNLVPVPPAVNEPLPKR
jgi:hypothetical protein